MQDNVRTFGEEKPLSPAENQLLLDIAEGMKNVIPCTGCRYCCDGCPMELDIPRILSLYNEHAYSEGGFIAPMALSALPDDKKPQACLHCRSCEQVCPQQLKISEIFEDFSEKLG
jgi:predicted aldo/keto reductase-like oxidoreductase